MRSLVLPPSSPPNAAACNWKSHTLHAHPFPLLVTGDSASNLTRVLKDALKKRLDDPTVRDKLHTLHKQLFAAAYARKEARKTCGVACGARLHGRES